MSIIPTQHDYDKQAAYTAGYEAGRAAIEAQAREIAELRAGRDHLESRYDAVVREQSEHCKDCCCARSWEALGITTYTGKSIPENIAALRSRAEAAEKDAARWRLALESQAREIAELRADLDKARTAIRVQAAAVRTLDTTGRVLAAHDRAAAERARSESRPEALESERAMNAQLTEENDALRARAEAAEKAIKDYNDSCIGACEYRVKTNHCEAYLGRGRNCPDCPRDDVIDYPAAIAAGGDDAKD